MSSSRAAGDPHESASEVRVIGKTGVLRDGRNRVLPMRELRACPCDTSPPEVLPHRTAESAPEQFGQVHGMDAGDACDFREPVGLQWVLIQVGYTPIEALVRLE